MSSKQHILTAALVGAMSPEPSVTNPGRARPYSLTSAISSMRVGDQPVARVEQLDADQTIADTLAGMGEATNALRNNLTSSVQAAKRRIPGAEFSIEIDSVKFKSGLYLVALVHRTA